MRPTAKLQSALRTPLNDILGTEANVRILRVLAEATVPLSRAEIGAASALHPSGIPSVLRHLEDIGLAEVIGSGRVRPVQMRTEHPLAAPLRALFHAEAERTRNVLSDIIGVLRTLRPKPAAAWIEGPVATGSDRYEDPIVVGVLADHKGGADWEPRLRAQFGIWQRQYDVAIELRVRWRADMLSASEHDLAVLNAVRPLIGPSPLLLVGLAQPEPPRTEMAGQVPHQAHDEHAREIARGIAEQLTTKPNLVHDAITSIERRMPSASTGEQLELQEWHDILTSYSLGRLRSFLVSESERATRLRQSLPFAFAITADDRNSPRRT